MTSEAKKIAALLFGSGACALIYQIVWMREFRHIFGASTAATAAVVAIFIGGLGLGGYFLGRRVDAHHRPLAFYAWLEVGIALSAAFTPALLWLVRHLYVALGGSITLGTTGATLLRLLFSVLVLAVPTFMMGGSLPAAARATATREDRGRRGVALLYGLNTLGAVIGCLLANFLLLEVLGAQKTLWIACLLNLLVAVTAFSLARKLGTRAERREMEEPEVKEALAPTRLVLVAACIVGFGFFLMELIWYRMLGPVLGGTIFTFGLILAVALFGIGVGGFVYSFLSPRRTASLLGFAYTCLFEAAFIALPFALGDRLAMFALLLKPLGYLGFWGHVLAWSLVTGVVVLPAAFIAGVQFPMLIALLGRGRSAVGRQVGLAYAFNTVGAIAGSLAGGFGLLPLMGALGAWRLVVYVLLALGAAALLGARRREHRAALFVPPVLIIIGALLLINARGPTAAWRHAQIGVGRVAPEVLLTPNSTRRWLNDENRHVLWEAEGIESSVAIIKKDGLAFSLNGKIDGNAKGDAATGMMAGLIGAIIKDHVHRAMVIGLGTGTTAGWLGAIPEMKRVDVMELEPAILRFAGQCAQVNQGAMKNPKIHPVIGDAREALLTTSQQYDLIVSEPSNPYRAGIASLFTMEFYQSISDRLTEDGVFSQWVQAYNIDSQTVRTIYATLSGVFPAIQTWQTQPGDLLLVALKKPRVLSVPRLRARLAQQPFKDAIRLVWRVTDLEGVFGHFLARAELAKKISVLEGDWVNSDDLNHVEFGFARSVSGGTIFHAKSVLAAAVALKLDRPRVVGGGLDWVRMEQERNLQVGDQFPLNMVGQLQVPTAGHRSHLEAFLLGTSGNWVEALRRWKDLGREPRSVSEISLVAEIMSHLGSPQAERYLDRLRSLQGTEADLIEPFYLMKTGRASEAAQKLAEAFIKLRGDMWPRLGVVTRALDLAVTLGSHESQLGRDLLQALSRPFATYLQEDRRVITRLQIAMRQPLDRRCLAVLADLEPHFPWQVDMLKYRKWCYDAASHPLAAVAAAELIELVSNQPRSFSRGLHSRGDLLRPGSSPPLAGEGSVAPGDGSVAPGDGSVSSVRTPPAKAVDDGGVSTVPRVDLRPSE